MLNTPILLLIFNRPEETAKVFSKIRAQKPKQLYIAADGPRINHLSDTELCNQCREIVKKIDWDCEFKLLFRDQNLGCGEGPATAISWFFDHVEKGIILEDDCLPNKSFFTFCETLLSRYAMENEVMMICGTSYQSTSLDKNTYYFSKYPHAWGWATWKNSWKKYSYSLTHESPEEICTVINSTFSDNRERRLWKYNMDIIKNGLDAWDYQWMYWIWKNNGLCIIPWKNTISNIGFGETATHTFDSDSSQSEMQQYEIETIIHPKQISLNQKADKVERYKVLVPTPFNYYRNRFIAAFKKLVRLLSAYK